MEKREPWLPADIKSYHIDIKQPKKYTLKHINNMFTNILDM